MASEAWCKANWHGVRMAGFREDEERILFDVSETGRYLRDRALGTEAGSEGEPLDVVHLSAACCAWQQLDDTRAFLNHPILGPRLLIYRRTLLTIKGKSVSDIRGSPDDTKLRSSMTLFALASGGDTVYHEVFEHFFGGQQGRRTLDLPKNFAVKAEGAPQGRSLSGP